MDFFSQLPLNFSISKIFVWLIPLLSTYRYCGNGSAIPSKMNVTSQLKLLFKSDPTKSDKGFLIYISEALNSRTTLMPPSAETTITAEAATVLQTTPTPAEDIGSEVEESSLVTEELIIEAEEIPTQESDVTTTVVVDIPGKTLRFYAKLAGWVRYKQTLQGKRGHT